MPYPFTPDPRPLEPPSYWADDPEPVPHWHFASSDGHEDYALSPAEFDQTEALYVSTGVPFTVTTHYALPD